MYAAKGLWDEGFGSFMKLSIGSLAFFFSPLGISITTDPATQETTWYDQVDLQPGPDGAISLPNQREVKG